MRDALNSSRIMASLHKDGFVETRMSGSCNPFGDLSLPIFVTGPSSRLSPRPAASETVGSSLSDIYGMTEFPWHTDGAIARQPPRLLIMYRLPNDKSVDKYAPTELLDLQHPFAEEIRGDLRRALVRGARPGWNSLTMRASEVVRGSRLYRWDPRFTVRSANSALQSDVQHAAATGSIEWERGTVAIIDNWRVLHRRPQLDPQLQSRVLYRCYGEFV